MAMDIDCGWIWGRGNAPLNNDYISFDLSTDKVNQLKIKKGDSISIRFKRGKLCYFSADKQACAGGEV